MAGRFWADFRPPSGWASVRRARVVCPVLISSNMLVTRHPCACFPVLGAAPDSQSVWHARNGVFSAAVGSVSITLKGIQGIGLRGPSKRQKYIRSSGMCVPFLLGVVSLCRFLCRKPLNYIPYTYGLASHPDFLALRMLRENGSIVF